MPVTRLGRLRNGVVAGASLVLLGACEPNGAFDPDLRNFGQSGLDTSAAALGATQARPTPDARGVISYPTYEVAVARPGDTLETIALRVGQTPGELGNYNAIPAGTQFRGGEVLALPPRVAGGAPPLGTLPGQPAAPGGGIDVATIASSAIDRAEAGGTGRPPASAPAIRPSGTEPVRHQVVRGETAYSIARLYNVNVRSLAEWNGLGADLAVREGQFLLIPVASASAPPAPAGIAPAPGEGTLPPPPSASEPLPAEKTRPAAAAPKPAPAPDLGATKTAASGARMAMPVAGKIISTYQKKKNEGIDIAAPAGTTVSAAADGTVAAITKDTDQVPILVLRHEGNLLTVYANIDGITVSKGDRVRRGQAIAKVRASDKPFLHFEVRQGFDSVDPMPYLQ